MTKRAAQTLKTKESIVVDSSTALIVRGLETLSSPMPNRPLGSLAQFENVKVLKSEDQYQEAAALGTNISAILSEIEEERKKIATPLTAASKTNNSRAKLMSAPFEKARDHLKNLCIQWHDAQRAKELAKAEKQAVKIAVESPQAAAEVLAVALRANPAPAQGVRYVTRVTGTVIDFAKLPDNYKLPDQRKIDAVIKAGGEIPGVERKETTEAAMSGRAEQGFYDGEEG